jgi:D-serine deaminase-like pyridoxal phosphate-dependent protein
MSNIKNIENPWFRINNEQEVPSPALLVYPDRIEYNIRKMIEIAGDVNMIRPHVKTHKMEEIIRLQMKHGIYKFKCATIAEAEMVARCGVKDILLAYQPVGPNIERFFRLKEGFSDAEISCIADTEEVIRQLSAGAQKHNSVTCIFLDINNGMDRTGIAPGKEAAGLFKLIADLPMLKAGGLHVYDGHIHEKDLSLRRKITGEAFNSVREMLDLIRKPGDPPVTIVAGGTPTFPVHAGHKHSETSPGTVLLWDYGYGSSYTDMEFLHAAALLTRIVSKPAKDLICLDIGHKAIAAEMTTMRVYLPQLHNYEMVKHSEEHMVLKTKEADKLKVGDVLYGIPYHICPTVDSYDFVTVVKDGLASGQWNVVARKRRINI